MEIHIEGIKLNKVDGNLCDFIQDTKSTQQLKDKNNITYMDITIENCDSFTLEFTEQQEIKLDVVRSMKHAKLYLELKDFDTIYFI